MRPGFERRSNARAWCLLGRAHLAARLRTGSPLRVLNTSPDGMLVESPARLLPGRQLDLVLQCGSSRENALWLVVHSRVGCLRGSSEIRYRAGLRRAPGTNYPMQISGEQRRKNLPRAGDEDQAGESIGSANASRGQLAPDLEGRQPHELP